MYTLSMQNTNLPTSYRYASRYNKRKEEREELKTNTSSSLATYFSFLTFSWINEKSM